LVRQLLSGYPNLKDVHDPEGYISSLCTILTLYDSRDAIAGVNAVADHREFPPSRFELRQACERAAIERLKFERLRGMGPPQPLKRLEKPADAPPDPVTGKHPPGTVLTNYDAAVRLYGKPIGEDDPRHSRFSGPTPCRAAGYSTNQSAREIGAKLMMRDDFPQPETIMGKGE
jgi:hypothetical protein